MKLETALTKAAKPQSSDIRTKMICVTPQFALAVLKDLNNSNRPLSKGVAALYANEMLRGQWKCNGEPLIFSVDADGNEHLISGQHRLQGLVLAQQAIEKDEVWPNAQTKWDTVVIYHVPHDTADTVDTGKTRSHSDVLFRDPWVDSVISEAWNATISKRKTWTKTLAGAARLVWLIEGGAIVSSAPKFLISEMLSFIQNRHADLATFVTMVLDANDSDGDNHGLKMSLPYLAALTYVASLEEIEVVNDDGNYVTELSINPETQDAMDTFLNQLAVGTGFEKGDPAWALTGFWNKLTAEPGSKDRDRDWVGPFVKAAKAYLDGRTGLKVSDVSLSKKERDGYTDFPVMFDGYHTLCFERAAAAKAAATQPVSAPSSGPDDVVDSGDDRPAEEPTTAAVDADESSSKAPQSTKRPAPKRKPKPAVVTA
jgi:hypothetical protein